MKDEGAAMSTSPYERRIGIEIEYSNLTLDQSADIVVALFGGTVVKHTSYDYKVVGTDLGDFTLELDLELLKKIAADPTFAMLSNLFDDNRSLSRLIENTAATVVPYEIATPPVPLSRIGEIDTLLGRLRLSGALGTSRALQYAFGMHLNIEPPALDVETVLRHFRSFLMLQPWLEQQTEVNITRRISPFISSFDETYVSQVMDPSYRPERDTFISDYIDYHPTRNMALDLLPLFAYWDAPLVFSLLPDEKIRPRPAFHYRLPNSKVDLFRWRLSDEWFLWEVVEKLAAAPRQFDALNEAFLQNLGDLFGDDAEWVERSHRCVLDLLSP